MFCLPRIVHKVTTIDCIDWHRPCMDLAYMYIVEAVERGFNIDFGRSDTSNARIVRNHPRHET